MLLPRPLSLPVCLLTSRAGDSEPTATRLVTRGNESFENFETRKLQFSFNSAVTRGSLAQVFCLKIDSRQRYKSGGFAVQSLRLLVDFVGLVREPERAPLLVHRGSVTAARGNKKRLYRDLGAGQVLT